MQREVNFLNIQNSEIQRKFFLEKKDFNTNINLFKFNINTYIKYLRLTNKKFLIIIEFLFKLKKHHKTPSGIL